MKLLKPPLIRILLLFSISCSGPNPVEELSPEDKDVYISNYDPAVDFSGYQTFRIVDSVSTILNEQQVIIERKAIDIAILNAIKEELLQLGYTQVADSVQSDIGITVSKISNNYTGVGYNYGGYGGYYDPFFGGYSGYGYNYPSYYVYEVRQGSVIVDMLDLKSASSGKQYKVVWSGQMIAGTGRLSSEERIVKGIRSLFSQAFYLKK